MPQEIKNQIRNILSWTRASGAEMSRTLITEIERFLGERGVPLRGPALVSFIESKSPKASQFLLQALKMATQPMQQWLGATIESIDNNRISLQILPQDHLIDKFWHPSIFTEASLEATKTLLERICPPGPLDIQLNNLDLQILSQSKDPLCVRLEIDSTQSEVFLRDLMTTRSARIHNIVNIFNQNERIIAKIELNQEIQWSPLIKS